MDDMYDPAFPTCDDDEDDKGEEPSKCMLDSSLPNIIVQSGQTETDVAVVESVQHVNVGESIKEEALVHGKNIREVYSTEIDSTTIQCEVLLKTKTLEEVTSLPERKGGEGKVSASKMKLRSNSGYQTAKSDQKKLCTEDCTSNCAEQNSEILSQDLVPESESASSEENHSSLQKLDVSRSNEQVKEQEVSEKETTSVVCEVVNKSYGAGTIPVNRDHSYSRKIKQGVFEKVDIDYSSDNHREDSNDSIGSSSGNSLILTLVQKKQLAKLSVISESVSSVAVIPSSCVNEGRTNKEETSCVESDLSERVDCEPLETVEIAVEDDDKFPPLPLDEGTEPNNIKVVSDVDVQHTVSFSARQIELNECVSEQTEEKLDVEDIVQTSPKDLKDSKKKARRSSNGVLRPSDQSSSSSTEDVPVRRSSRIRSLEEKKEKVKEPKPKKERTPKGPKQDVKKKTDKTEVKAETESTQEPPEVQEIKPVVASLEETKGNSLLRNDNRDDSSNGDTNSLASSDSAPTVAVPTLEPKILPSPSFDIKREEDVIMRPEKVKSRWRRSSEMEWVSSTSQSMPSVNNMSAIVEETLAVHGAAPASQLPVLPPPLPVALSVHLEKDSPITNPSLVQTSSPVTQEPQIPSSLVNLSVSVPVPVVPAAGLLPTPVAASTTGLPVLGPPPPPPPLPSVTSPTAKVAAMPEAGKSPVQSQPLSGAQDLEPKSPTYELIEENIYLFDSFPLRHDKVVLVAECTGGFPHKYMKDTDKSTNILYKFRRRSKSKKEVRRMLCDCTLTKEEKEQGVVGCTQDCLNRLLMIECGSRCSLGDACSNKRFQRKANAKTEPFKTEKKGWGLRAVEDIPSSTFIMEYVGEVLSPLDFKQRVKHYAKGKNNHYYFMALKGDEILDATSKGNSSRFINHSCDPNCETQKWTVNGELHIGFFTTRDVKAYEELTFDYQFQRYGREAQRCYCESSKCRGFIGGDTQISLKSGKSYVQKKQRNRSSEGRKREVLEDLAMEEEIEKLSANGGLRNQEQTLMLARLMVKAEDHDTRQRLLDIVQNTTEQACLRLFLDYHGLSLLWSWMVDLGDDASQLKTQILQILALLPISNKTMLLDSKVFSVVQRWASQAVTSPLLSKIDATEEQVQPDSAVSVACSSLEEGSSSETTTTSTQPSNVIFNSESFVIDDLDSIPLPPMPPPPQNKNSKKENLEVQDEIVDGKIETILANASVDSPEEPSASKTKKESVQENVQESGDHLTREESPPEGSTKKTDENGLSKSDSDESHDMPEEDEGSSAGSSSCCTNSSKQDVSGLAVKIIESWSSLKEVFRIPRLEQEKRKEDERAAAQQHQQDWELSPPRHGNHRHDSSPSPSSRSRKRHKEIEVERRPSIRSPLLPTPPKLSKAERRHLFAMEVQQRDQEEAMRRQQHISSMAMSEFGSSAQMPYMYDPSSGVGYSAVSYNTGLGYTAIDPNTGYQISTTPVDPNTGFPLQPLPIDQFTIQGGAVDPNTGYPLQATPMDPNTGYPLQQQQQQQQTCLVDPNSGFSIQVPSSAQEEIPLLGPNSVVTTSVPANYAQQNAAHSQQLYQQQQQQSNSFAPSPVPVQPQQQISYLSPVVASSHPTTEDNRLLTGAIVGPPPTFHPPVASPSIAVSSPLVGSSPSLLPTPNQQVITQSPMATGVGGAHPTTNFVSPANPPPFLATSATPAPQATTQLYYVQSTGAVVSLPPDQPLASAVTSNLGPLVHVAVASAAEDLPVPPPKSAKPPSKLPPNWKTAKDEEGNIYYYHSITRETQWDPPTIDDDDEDDDGDSMDLGTPTFDEPKVGIRIKQHHHPSSSSSSSSSKKKTTTAAADTSSEVAKKIKELFRSKMSGYIVQCLNPYRKPDCKIGRISNTEDFKHLARKLTHFVMSKELKYCKNVEDLECNENVKHKAKDFVYKYMSKYGPEYRKDKHGSPRNI